MKKALLILTICMVAGVASYGQGTVNFTTRFLPEVDARVFDVDTVTPLAGDNFSAQLWAGPTAAEAQAVGPVTTFRTGGFAGYVVAAGEVVIPGVPGGEPATIQLRAWDNRTGATWETASIKGESDFITISTGNPGAIPPGLPTNLIGLSDFHLVPEPSTIALAVLGAFALLLRRRKQ